MKKIKINVNNIKESFLYLERGKKYENYENTTLLQIALDLILLSEKLKDWRYLNLTLKIRDIIPKNILLNKKIKKLIFYVKKNKKIL
tara:strand:- start:559 stop:819 length:261 start_codon:yes stop_codon:yes gene_type:complete